jgi:hypothetical protein
MSTLARLQERILCLLEEAGEEEFCSLMNTVAKARGAPAEIEAMGKALTALVNGGLVEIAFVRDELSLNWIPLQTAEAHRFLQDLISSVQWSVADRLWRWRSKKPRGEILLTDLGAKQAERVLLEEGWPEKPLDHYE